MSDNPDLESLKGWRLLRSINPPWQNLDDPLIHHEVRPHRRTGGTPLGFLIIAILIAAGLITYLVLINFFTNTPDSLRQMVENSIFILMLGLCSMSVLGHWRLLLAINGRSSAAIAQRRASGDWDLISITPVSKARWFRAQMTALGWQVFPLVRRLMLVHLLLVIIAIPGMIVLHQEQFNRVPSLLYAMELLPFAALMLVEPVFSAGVFLSSTLLESSLRQRTWVAFLNGMGAVYLMRLVMALVLIVGGVIMAIGMAQLLYIVGLQEYGVELDNISRNDLFIALFYGGIAALVTAFVIEWIPPTAAIAMMSIYDIEGSLFSFAWLLLTFLLVYIITPPILMNILAKRTVKRLNRPES